VTIEVENRTSDLVWVHSAVRGDCESFPPAVEAIDARRQAVDLLPGRPIPSCPLLIAGPHTPGFLRPGQRLQTTVYAVLLTNRLRARTAITRYRTCDPRLRTTCRGQEEQILGDPLRFVVRSAPAPRIVLHGLPPVSFRLLPASRRPAPLWYEGWFTCGPGQSWGVSQGGIGTVLRPGNSAPVQSLRDCSPKAFALHLIAGHPGQPVAFITEQRGKVRP